MSSHNRSYTGQVLGGDWDQDAKPMSANTKVMACQRHWRDGLSWEETGIVEEIVAEIEEHGSKDGCHNRDEVLERYRQLDLLYEQVRKESRLKTRKELDPSAYREVGGIYIHIDRNGCPIFGDAGCHRMAIAREAHLPVMPAQLGVVHEDALLNWKARFLGR